MSRSRTLPAALLITLALLGLPGRSTPAQTWRDDARHLGTTARVLLIGTRPEDEDNALIAWLSLGRHIETAYLSLTRGESGVNRIGGESEAALAVVRTAELLAERERDGARQYFTRAYDFGHTDSDSIVDVAWPHDVLLEDVVSIVRAFRPHVIIALTRADDPDATRRAAARLAGEAFALAADSVTMPASTTARLAAWRVGRLFTLVPAESSGLPIDVGEFDRSAGKSYAELGAEIRRLQRTQGAPPAPSLGRIERRLRLDSTRAGTAPTLFGAIDTTLARFHEGIPSDAIAHLDTLRTLIALAATVAAREPGSGEPGSGEPGSGEAGSGAPTRDEENGPASPDSLATLLARVARRTSDVRLALPCTDVDGVPACSGDQSDLARALIHIRERATRAMLGAAGLVIDGTVERELVAARDSVLVTATVYNGGARPVVVGRLAATAKRMLTPLMRDTALEVPPGEVATRSGRVIVTVPSFHWWQIQGLREGSYVHAVHGGPGRVNVIPQLIAGEDAITESSLEATVAIGGVDVPVIVRPLVYRGPTAQRGDVRRPLAGVPATSVILEQTAEFVRAGRPIDRLFRVFVKSDRSATDTLEVMLELPRGIRADSATRTVVLPPFASRNVFFRLHGVPRAGTDTIGASARHREPASSGDRSVGVRPAGSGDIILGAITHEYPHIPAQQFVRFANDRIEAVDLRIPSSLAVVYVKGDEDLRKPLSQLGIMVQTLDASLLPVVDLSRVTTVLIGAGALADDAMAGAIPALQSFMRRGGTLVVFPGGAEVASSGLFPYPIVFDGLTTRVVRDPAAPMRVAGSAASIARWPNPVTRADLERWVGVRARGIPASFDPRYATAFVVGDDGEPATGTLLMARVGKGQIIYTALTLDQQIAAVNPGAARLLVNLLSAGLASAR